MIQLVRLDDHIIVGKKKTFQSLYCHVGFFGQVVLWFGQVKYTLHLSEQINELRRKFPALQICQIWCILLQTFIHDSKKIPTGSHFDSRVETRKIQ